MSGHSHYRTMRDCLAAAPWLLVVLLLEVPAAFVGQQLTVIAHIFDIFSDLLAFLLVIAGAFVSGFLDDQGRDHKHNHTEQTFIAEINFWLLMVGAGIVFFLTIVNLGRDSQKSDWSEWWILLGPALALFAYLWIGKRLEQISVRDITTVALSQHVKGDVLLALGVLFLTALNMTVQVNWVSSVVGVIMASVLIYLAYGLKKEIIRERARE